MQLSFTLSTEHPSLPGHFPGQPMAPAALLLDEVAHRFSLATGLKVNTVKHVRFMAPLLPSQQLDVEYQPKTAAEYRFIGTVKGNPVLKGALDYTAPEPKYVPFEQSLNGHSAHVSTPIADIRDCYRRLPHSGDMRLLQHLLYCSEQSIVCQAGVQQPHPLSRQHKLPAWASLEYAAQALACHGLLTLSAVASAANAAAEPASFRHAMIIGIRELSCQQEFIHPYQPCHIEVQLQAQQPQAASCIFRLSQNGQPVSNGQFNVVYAAK
jgi:predicted hotdog family 3-hydroxylacyl-ACP dehydratase